MTLLSSLGVSLLGIFQEHTKPVVINDTTELRALLQKPFEGVWNYRIDFSIFFGRNENFVSTGKAIFLWNPAAIAYDVYIGYSIHSGWSDERVIAAFLGGSMKADYTGWPSQEFEMNMQYLERVGTTGTGIGGSGEPHAFDYRGTGQTSFAFTNCTYIKSKTLNRAETITAIFKGASNKGQEDKRTIGEVTFSR